MTALQKNVQLGGFSTEYDVLVSPQNAYSHGFESIYKLECIDLKSVRKFAAVEEKPVLKTSKEETFEPLFDLGPFFRGWMVPTLLSEPLAVLQLSKPVEKTLLEKGYRTLGDLEQAVFHDMGQGHIEEVKRKLRQYTEGKPRQKVARIDFQSLVKCLFADLEWKKVSVFLSGFDIAEWVVLSPADSADVKKLSFDNRQKWSDEVLERVLKKQKTLEEFFSVIAETWIKPWMMARGGLATKEEITEALLLRSLESSFAKGALGLFFSLGDPFKSLYAVTGGYAASRPIQLAHLKMEKTALSYFKSPSTRIFLKDLSLWVANEFASKWDAASPEPSIRFSSCFEVTRDAKSGEWIVEKSFFGGEL